MKKILSRLWNEKIAQDTTEYALLLLLIALSAITATKTLANGIKGAYSNVGSNITSHTNGGGGNGGGNNGGGNNGGGNNGGGNNGGGNNGGGNNGGGNNGGFGGNNGGFGGFGGGNGGFGGRDGG